MHLTPIAVIGSALFALMVALAPQCEAQYSNASLNGSYKCKYEIVHGSWKAKSQWHWGGGGTAKVTFDGRGRAAINEYDQSMGVLAGVNASHRCNAHYHVNYHLAPSGKGSWSAGNHAILCGGILHIPPMARTKFAIVNGWVEHLDLLPPFTGTCSKQPAPVP